MTTDKPTKPGKYWIAIHPKWRSWMDHKCFPHMLDYASSPDNPRRGIVLDKFGGMRNVDLDLAPFDGAIYFSREMPPDPFAKD